MVVLKGGSVYCIVKCLDVRNEFFVALLPLRRSSELDTLWTQTSVDQSRVRSDHSWSTVESISVFEANAETVVGILSYVLSLNWKRSNLCSKRGTLGAPAIGCAVSDRGASFPGRAFRRVVSPIIRRSGRRSLRVHSTVHSVFGVRPTLKMHERLTLWIK